MVSSPHLNVEVFSHSVDPDSMESSVCQVSEDGAEHVRTPVRLKVIPDLQTPWTQSRKFTIVFLAQFQLPCT